MGHLRKCRMADAIFEERRLAELYDPLEPDRADLLAYIALTHTLGSRSVLDLGCGTGTFACMLAERGMEVTGVDPAAASLDVARVKPFGDQVRWIEGMATSLPPLHADLVTMTGNVAQVFLTDEEWDSTLRAARSALRPGGYLVFEVRDPAREGWKEWTRELTLKRVHLPDVGTIETWVDLVDVSPPFVSFRWTFVFETEGTVRTSDSILRFRERAELSESLRQTGFEVEDIRDAPDRPGRELVFIAMRSAEVPIPTDEVMGRTVMPKTTELRPPHIPAEHSN
jgi:SAM-dependent methyltransferase